MKEKKQKFDGGTVIKFDGKDKIIIIPDGIIKIASYAFAGTNVEMVVCSSSLEEIGDYAFFNCLNLREIHLNQKLKLIGRNPFANCPSLEKIFYYGTKEEFEKILKGEPFGDSNIVFKKEAVQK